LFYRKPRGQIPQQEYVSPQKIIPQLKMNVYTTWQPYNYILPELC
jgi:hypothetical protein